MGSVVVDCGVDSGAACVVDSKARVLAVISLKTYTRTTRVLTNHRVEGYEWTAIPALPLGLLLSLAAGGIQAGSMQSPASR